ncbi:MAG: polysaccharide deacetylase family protein [Parvibaculum sp.]
MRGAKWLTNAGLMWLALTSWAQAAEPICEQAGFLSRTLILPASVQSYGTMQYQKSVGVEDKELVLTFDDGPDPVVTPQILDTLDQFCVKATFFMTGLRAERYPELVQEVARRGHTIASHSYSHPNNLRRLGWNSATRQISRGINEIQEALDAHDDTKSVRVAPFFRFPGLNHSTGLRGWLANQNISTFSCDAGTDDWRRISSNTLTYRALRNIRSTRGGIVIFHDTKPRTAAALPSILQQLQNEGYHVAHMIPARDAATTSAKLAAAPITAPDMTQTAPSTETALRSSHE